MAIAVQDQAVTAYHLDQSIQARRLRIETEFVGLGSDLARMRDEELYRLLGCETFDAYLAAPERGFSRRTAYGLIAASDVCNRLHMTSEQAAAIGYVKLEIIRRPILEGKSTPEEWLHDAAALGKEDLKQKVREALGGAAVTSEEDEREEDAVWTARLQDLLSKTKLTAVEYGRWSGLRISFLAGPTIKVWAVGSRLKVEIE